MTITVKRFVPLAALALLLLALLVSVSGQGSPARAQEFVSFGRFHDLTPEELQSLQIKLTYVGPQEKSILTVAFSAEGSTLDMSRFTPFRRQGIHYGNDDLPSVRTFQATTAELVAALAAAEEIPAATEGAIVQGEFLSFSWVATDDGIDVGFESILAAEDARVLLDYVRTSLSADNAGRAALVTLAEELGFRRIRLSLAEGWNLLSLPEALVTTTPAWVLSSIRGSYDIVFAFDSSDPQAPWRRYVYPPPGADGINTLTAIDGKTGFWILMRQADTLALSGSTPPSTDIDLPTGWSLVPYPSHQTRSTEEVLASIADKAAIVFGYDAADPASPWRRYIPGADPALNDLAQVAPGGSFWILMNEPATLTIVD